MEKQNKKLYWSAVVDLSAGFIGIGIFPYKFLLQK
jgi:hypothetical protein